jgi:hypothetical protein
MALTELEIKRCGKTIASFLERRRPPPEIREMVDLTGRIGGHSVEIFERRPAYYDPSTK